MKIELNLATLTVAVRGGQLDLVAIRGLEVAQRIRAQVLVVHGRLRLHVGDEDQALGHARRRLRDLAHSQLELVDLVLTSDRPLQLVLLAEHAVRREADQLHRSRLRTLHGDVVRLPRLAVNVLRHAQVLAVVLLVAHGEHSGVLVQDRVRLVLDHVRLSRERARFHLVQVHVVRLRVRSDDTDQVAYARRLAVHLLRDDHLRLD